MNTLRIRSRAERLRDRAIRLSHRVHRGGATAIGPGYRVITAVMYPQTSQRTYVIGGVSDFAVMVV